MVKDAPVRRAPRFRGRIEFEDVTFGYGRGGPVLKHVSLSIEPGQVAALVGLTEAEKTTIINSFHGSRSVFRLSENRWRRCAIVPAGIFTPTDQFRTARNRAVSRASLV